MYTEWRAVIINIQEALDQILFTPAVINQRIDVPANTDVPRRCVSNPEQQLGPMH